MKPMVRKVEWHSVLPISLWDSGYPRSAWRIFIPGYASWGWYSNWGEAIQDALAYRSLHLLPQSSVEAG
jgi:hypothetical protein